VGAGDFNGDGRPDLAFAGYDRVQRPSWQRGNFTLSVFLNTGDGTFAEPLSYSNTCPDDIIVTGDFDGDGHLDIAETTFVQGGPFGVLAIFFNTGDGTFRDQANFIVNPDSSANGMGVADFNGDGVDDIATTTILNPNTSNAAYVLEVFNGSRNGCLDRPAVYPAYPIAVSPSLSLIVTGDFNGDGKPDIATVLGGSYQNDYVDPIQVTVFENQGDGTFAAPVIYRVGGAILESPSGLAVGDFNGDGVTDIAVGTTGVAAPHPSAVNVFLSTCE
jgi:hypothetical protein